jgi:L-alanine-DL-glutamate epimerase-like enolase superfamily enzyme
VYDTIEGGGVKGDAPEDYAEATRAKKASPEGFTIIKNSISLNRMRPYSGYVYGEIEKTGLSQPSIFGSDLPTPKEWVGKISIVSKGRGELTERGVKYVVACIKATKEVLGDEIGLAIDGLQGVTIQSCLRIAKAVEPFSLMWLEDMITGDYTPYTAVEAFRLVSSNTTTPIHTGEQIYLRQGFKDLIEKNAVDVIGPDPCDVGGIAELKWIAEFADLHGVTIAPHGVGNGIIGAAALVQVCATMPKNFIAFELPVIPPVWWELTEGLPKPLVKDGFAEIPERPGLGVELNEKAVRKHLLEGDDFFATKGK